MSRPGQMEQDMMSAQENILNGHLL